MVSGDLKSPGRGILADGSLESPGKGAFTES